MIHNASYRRLLYYDAGMKKDNSERRMENSKKPSQIGSNNKDQGAIVGKDTKKTHERGHNKPKY